MTTTESQLRSLPHRDLLKGNFVFLSASFPSERRSPTFFKSADPDEIAQAVVAAARAILSSKGRLVFGGHPTISPLVLMVAEEYLPSEIAAREDLKLRGEAAVVVYQSQFFGTVVPEATMNLYKWGLAELVWTEAAKGEDPARQEVRTVGQGERSLLLMREQMLRGSSPLGAIFIGGMEGVRDEASLFVKMFRKRPTYFIGGPGGAAREFAPDYPVELRPASRLEAEELAKSGSYPALMQRIVLDMADRL